MSKFAREYAVESLVAAADHSGSKGHFVELSSGQAAIVNAATDVPYGIILVGETAGKADSIGVLGGNLGPVPVKAGGAISKGDFLELTANGDVVPDSGSGARVIVGRAMEDAADDERFEAVVFNPVVYAS